VYGSELAIHYNHHNQVSRSAATQRDARLFLHLLLGIQILHCSSKLQEYISYQFDHPTIGHSSNS
jgi:hypothetical protein